MGTTRLSPARQFLALFRHADLFERHRREVFYVLAAAALLFLWPTVNHFQQGRAAQGAATLVFNLCLFANAWCWFRARPMLVPAWGVLLPALAAVVLAIRGQGLNGLLWTFPLILLFHFLVPRRLANVFNVCIVATVVPVAWAILDGTMALRFAVTLLLTILFTNVFSTIAEAQQRKEVEQREKLDAQARQLQVQNEALRAAIRVREEVERIARHDLRTPLASIASVPRLLREGRALDPREAELVGMVERAALRVLSMVNLSLDLYRMESGTYPLRAQAVDLAALVQTVARELQGHVASKALRLVSDLPSERVLAQGEELLCYSIVANLLKNALEAAPDGSEVRIALQREGDEQVRLAIHNSGAVPEAIRADFFTKYATHGKAGGTGLGAYSAKLMAQVQHGELRMATGEEGTTMTLVLPAWSAAAPAQATDGTLLRDDAQHVHGPLPALSLLVVDDDEYNIIVFRSLLPSPPLVVRTAVNGRAALESVREARPDIIFLDLEMPVMGGLEAIGRIRELQRQRGEAPSLVAAFSAHDDEATRERCRAAGFDLYLAKPASREEVFAVLRGQDLPAAPADAPGPAGERVLVEADLMPLMPQFLASRLALAREMAAAARNGEREKVRQAAHKLAGSLAMYGFDAAGRACRRVEQAAHEGDVTLLRDQCEDIAAQIERLKPEARPAVAA